MFRSIVRDLTPAIVVALVLTAAMGGAMAMGYVPTPEPLRELLGQARDESTEIQPKPAEVVWIPVVNENTDPANICRFCGKKCKECPPPSPDEEISVDLRLLQATYPDGREATDVPELTFDLWARWPGYRGSEEIVVRADKQEARKLQLGLCTVKVVPVAGAGESTRPEYEHNTAWQHPGAYQLELLDEQGRLIDSIAMGYTPPIVEQSQHYSTQLIPKRGKFGDRIDVYEGRHKKFNGLTPLFSYEVVNSGTEQQDAVSPEGHVHSYIFPVSSLRIYPNALVEQQRLARLTDRDRKLKYGWAPPEGYLASASYSSDAPSSYTPVTPPSVGGCSGGG